MIDVVMPCYNEALALRRMLATIPAGLNIIVADNGSTDGSPEIAHSHGVTVIFEGRRGVGFATNAGLRAATSEIVCVMDCDGTVALEDVIPLASQIASGKADIVIGTRVFERGSASLVRRTLIRLKGLLVGSLVNNGVRDLGSARAFRREIVVSSPNRLGNGTNWSTDLVILASEAGYRIGVWPTPFRPRLGQSKVTGTLSGALLTIYETLYSVGRFLLRRIGYSLAKRVK